MEFSLLAVLLVSLLASTLAEDTPEELFDLIFNSTVLDKVVASDYVEMPIPDLNQKIEVDLLLVKVVAYLHCSRGTLRDMTTMHRVGNVQTGLDSDGEGKTLVAPMSMSTLSIHFRHYTLEAGFLEFYGDKMAFDVGKNAFDVTMVARLNQEVCDVQIRDVKIKDFGDVSVDITGFGSFNPIAQIVGELFIGFFNDLVKGWAETFTEKMLNHAPVRTPELCRQVYNVVPQVRVDIYEPTTDVKKGPVVIYVQGNPVEVGHLNSSGLFQSEGQLEIVSLEESIINK